MTSPLTLNRRTILAGAGAAAAWPLLDVTTVSAIGKAAMPLRALHRFHVGQMRVTVIDDARITFPAPMFAANQPEGTIDKFLKGFGLPSDTVSMHMQVTLVETGAHKVLLDTGMGDFTLPKNKPDNGRLKAGLAAIGVTPDDITAVTVSHGHPDHIGACTTNGKPTFKNAKYYIAPNELEFWTQKPGSEQSLTNLMLGIGNAQLNPVKELIRPLKDGEEVAPGIMAIAAPGHTIGHHAFMLKDGDQRLLHIMDAAVHHLVGPEEPDWALGVEMDQKAAADTRRKLFQLAAEEALLVAGYHFPFPGVGRIVTQGNAWRYVPAHTA